MAVTIISIKANPAMKTAVDNAIAKALEICGEEAETKAKELCPVKTGNLREHITHRANGANEMQVGSPTEYAPYVEFGHHQVGSGKFVPGKPYLTPAIENHVEFYKQIIEGELSKL